MAAATLVEGSGGYCLSHTFELCPDFSLKAYFFANVTNGGSLVGDMRKQDMVVFINLDLLAGPFTLLSAANKAVVSHVDGTRKTFSLGTECLYNLSPSKSIDKAMKVFGPNEDTKNLAAVVFLDHRLQKPKESDDASSVLFAVQGTQMTVEKAFPEKDEGKQAALQGMYKVSDAHVQLKCLDDAVATIIMMRDVK